MARKIEVEITGDSRGYERALSRAGTSTSRFGRTTSSLARNLGHFAKIGVGAALSVGVAFAGMAIYKGGQRAVAIDDATRKLEGLGYTAQEVAKITDQALKAVLGTPYSLAEAINTAANAMAAGVKPGKDLTKYLGTVADAASIAGTNMDEMGSVLNKATANVKVHSDVLNSLADRGLPVFSWLQKEYDVTGEKLSEMVSQGKVDSETLMRVIRDNIGGAAKEAGEGIRGSFANMMTAIARLGDALVSPVFKNLPDMFNGIRDGIDKVTPHVARFGDFIAKQMPMIRGFLMSVVNAVRNRWPVIQQVFAGVVGYVQQTLIPRFNDLRKWLTGVIRDIARVFEQHRPELMRLWNDLKTAAQGAWEFIQKNVLPLLRKALPGAIGASLPILANLADAFVTIIGWANSAADAIRGLVSAINSIPAVGGGGLMDLPGMNTSLMDLIHGHRAAGGPVSAGRAYVVGERGPEIFAPRSSGTIIPNGGGTVPVAVYLDRDVLWRGMARAESRRARR